MVVEPPGEPGRGAVLEVDDRILVTVEELFFYQLLIWLVGEAGKCDFRRRLELIDKETREDGRGREAVEAVIVMQDSEFHSVRWVLLVPSRMTHHCNIERAES